MEVHIWLRQHLELVSWERVRQQRARTRMRRDAKTSMHHNSTVQDQVRTVLFPVRRRITPILARKAAITLHLVKQGTHRVVCRLVCIPDRRLVLVLVRDTTLLVHLAEDRALGIAWLVQRIPAPLLSRSILRLRVVLAVLWVQVQQVLWREDEVLKRWKLWVTGRVTPVG